MTTVRIKNQKCYVADFPLYLNELLRIKCLSFHYILCKLKIYFLHMTKISKI